MGLLSLGRLCVPLDEPLHARFVLSGVQMDAETEMVYRRQWSLLQADLSNGKEGPDPDGNVALLRDEK